jgi:hypothetical protein
MLLANSHYLATMHKVHTRPNARIQPYPKTQTRYNSVPPKGADMPSPILRLSLCILVATTLAGCGGGSSNSGSSGSGNGGGGNGGGGTNPATVTYTFSSTGLPPAALATRIGNGAFASATLSSGKLVITLPAGETTYSIAWLCPSAFGDNPTDNIEYVYNRSILDGTSFTAYCYGVPTTGTPTPTGTLTAQINAAAISGGQAVEVYYEPMPWSDSILDFNLTLADGTYDIPVTVTSGNTYPANFLAVKVLRNQTVPGALNGGQPVVLQTSDQTVPQAVTFNSVPDDFTVDGLGIEYIGKDEVFFSYNTPQQPTQYLAMPADVFQTGDYYQFTAQALNSIHSQSVWVETYANAGGPQSFTFPTPWSYSGPTPAALPTLDLSYSGFSGKPDIDRSATIGWTLTNNGFVDISNSIVVDSSANFQNGSTSITVPDLSKLTGFVANPPSGTSVYWGASIGQGNPFATTPPSGSEPGVSVAGHYNVP